MSDPQPLITICITTYNRWSQCARAVSSVLAQENLSPEVILVDDHSDEEIPANLYRKLTAFGGRYIRHEQNLGLAGARNTAIQAASGTWFAFCDDDDQWPPGFAERLLAACETAPVRVDGAIGLTRDVRSKCASRISSLPSIRELMLGGITPPVAAQMYRTEVLRTVGGYDKRIRSGVDHDLWITLAAAERTHRMAIAWGAQPIVGAEPGKDRMTTNEQRRRAGINEALEIWKPRLLAGFDLAFYTHFRRAYSAYLDRKFFVHSLRSRRLLRAATLTLRPAVSLWVIRRLLCGRQRSRGCGLFPPYQPGLGSRD